MSSKTKHIRRSTGSIIGSIVICLMILFMCLITLYPFYYIIVVSLSSGSAVMNHRVSFWIVDFTLESYKTIFAEPYLTSSYGNTLLYTLVGTVINLIMTTLCAYPLAQPNLPFKKGFMRFVIVTMFFSGGMIPSYLVIRDLHLLNTIWAVVLPGAISTYNMIIMRTFFTGIPRELHEASYLDGAGELQTLIRVVLPLSMPIMATMTLFYAVGHWNSYLNALIYLDDRSKFPLQVFLRNVVIDSQMSTLISNLGSANDFASIETTIKYAIIVVATLPIMLVYPFLQKFFVKGVMIGSLKG